MVKLFDLAIPAVARPNHARDGKRRREDELRYAPTTRAIWSTLLDHGADPLMLAALLRDSVSPNDRRRAYYELVHHVGPILAERAWEEAFVVRDRLARRAFPVGVREIAEAALGTPLVGVHVVTGELVDLVAERLDTPAFNIGSEIFVRGDALTGDARAIMVHEAIHAAQQSGASAHERPAAPTRAAEDDAHRVLKRIGPMDAGDRIVRERARAATVVRAALGRTSRIAARPLQVSAYEPTPGSQLIVEQAKQLADAVVTLLERNAAVEELKAALGPVAEDDTATRIYKVALQLLADRLLAGGANARTALGAKLGGLALSALGLQRGKPVPGELKPALESKLGANFDRARLHDDAAAARKTAEAGAIAVAQGNDVYFAPGKLNPETEEGRRLLAHELAHVAQQQRAPRAASSDTSSADSAVEREAERVGRAFARGQADATVRESAPHGTISHDNGKASGPWTLKLLDRVLDLDLATAVEAVGGKKKLTLPKTQLGPVRLDEITVELDGATVQRGYLKASLDDGLFKGSAATLSVDASGQVSGQLNLLVNIPGALAKNVAVLLGHGGLDVTVPLAIADFLSTQLPVAASAMSLKLSQLAAGLSVQLDGSAQVKLDAGFANARGTMTAQLHAGLGGVAIDATVKADLEVPGLGKAAAFIHWDGNETSLTVKSDVKIPGVAGTAHLDYKNGKLSVTIPDLKLLPPALRNLKLGPARVDDGVLKAHVESPDGATFELPGLKAVFESKTSLDLDGDKVAGRAMGHFDLGPEAARISGDFDFGFDRGSLGGKLNNLSASFMGAKVRVNAGGSLAFDEHKGVSGHLSSVLELGAQSLALDIQIADNDIADITVAGHFDIQSIVPALTGKLNVRYHKGAADPIELDAKAITASNPALAKYLKIDHFKYAGGKMSAAVTVSTGELSANLGGKQVHGQITEGHGEFSDGKLSGFIKGEFDIGGLGKAKGTITLKPDGSVDVKGAAEIQAGPITNHYLEGTLKASNEGGVKLSGSVQFKKGPLADKFDRVMAAFEGEQLSAAFNFSDKSLPSFGGIKVSGVSGTLGVTASTHGELKLDGRAKAHAKIKDYAEGDIEVGYTDGKFSGGITVTKLNVDMGPAAVNLNGFKLTIDEQQKLHVDGAGEIDVRYGDVVTAKLKIGVSGNDIQQVDMSGTVRGTKFTKQADIKLHYRDGQFGGSFKIKLDSLDGILDDGAELTAEGAAGKGIHASAKGVHFNKGLLKGWTINEASLDGTRIHADIGAPGGELEIGGVKAKLDPGARLVVDSVAGFTDGNAAGTITIKGIDPIPFSVKAAGGKLLLSASTTLSLAKLTSDLLDGSVTVGVHENKFEFKVAKGVKVKNESIANVLTIDTFEYKNGEFDAHITVNKVAFTSGTSQAKVTGGFVAYNHGKLNGEITGEAEVGSSKISAKVSFKNGQLELEVGGEFDIGGFTAQALKGRVKASTGGNVTLLEPITFDANGPLKVLKNVEITHLNGDIKAGHFSIGVKLNKAISLMETQFLKINNVKGEGTFTYNKGSVSGGAGVSGDGEVKAGDKTVLSGKFSISYKDGKLNGAVDQLKLNIDNQYFGIDSGSVNTETGEVKADIWVAIKGVVRKSQVKVHINVNNSTFEVGTDVHLDIEALRDVELHAGIKKDGSIDIKAKIEGAKTIKLPAGGELTLDAKSNLGYEGGKLSGALKGKATLGSIADGSFDFTIDGAKVDGTLDLKLKKLPMLKPGVEIHAVFKDNKISTPPGKPIKLELAAPIDKYVKTTIELKITDNRISVSGHINEITGLGKLGKTVKGGKVHYDDSRGQIDIDGTLDVSKLPGMQPNSELTLGVRNGSFYAAGKLKLQSKGGLKVTGGFDFEWKDGAARLTGGCHADIYGLAELDIKVTNDPKQAGASGVDLPEGSTDFKLSGKLTVAGLMKKFPSIQFSKPPEMCFWATAGNGELDYGIDNFNTTIVKLPGVDSCNIAVAASYSKADGFNASVDLGSVKIKMFKLSGGASIKASKFEEAHIGIESDISAVNLAGQIKIHAGDMDKLNAEARVDVKPGSGSSLTWLEQGSAEVAFKEGRLESVKGSITLRKPPLLPLEKTKLELIKDGDDITGSLDTDFTIPFGNGKKGHLTATFGGPEKWSIAISAQIKPPGFKTGTIAGKVAGNGEFSVEGKLEADGNKLIRAASMRLGYTNEKGFYLGGSVTLRINDKLAGEIDVEYDSKTEDFLFKGTVTPIKTEADDKSVKQLAGFNFGTDIPLFSVGVASLNLKLFAGFSFNMEMPSLQFRKLTVEGSLKSLMDGKLPLIRVEGDLGMGVSAAFELGIGVTGKIQLLIASAEASLYGKFIAKAGLKIGAKITGVVGGDNDGLDITIEPEVTPKIELSAELHASFYARIFFFTIIDKDWKLGSIDLASFDLPSWKPFDPFTLNIGGSGPLFKSGFPSPKTEKPPGLEDGAKKGSEDTEDQTKDAETKTKVRPVMQAIKDAAAKLEQLPPDWRNGITDPPDIEDVWLVPKDARELYAKRCDECEQWMPELAARTPAEKLAKSIATGGFFARLLASKALMGWRRAQIAHMGINPDDGTDVVALRARCMEMENAKYQKELLAAQQAQQAQDDEWAASMVKQAEDFAKAEEAHAKKFEQTKREYELKIKQLEHEGRLAKQKVEEAEKEAKKEGAKEKPTEQEKAPPPPPPPAPEPPPPLAKPEPIAKKPPIPVPPPPPPLPPVIVPALPTTQGEALDFGSGDCSAVQPAPAPPREVQVSTPTPPPPPSGEGAAPGPAQPVSMGGGGGGGGGGAKSSDQDLGVGTPSGSKGGGGGGGAATVEGSKDMVEQADVLYRKLMLMTFANAMGMGAKAPAAGPPPPPNGNGNANGNANANANANAKPDATVQRVVDAGKKDEDKTTKESEQKEHEYQQKIQQKKVVSGKGVAKLKEAAKKQHAANEKKQHDDAAGGDPHKLPPDGDFPQGESEQARVAFSNWIKLELTGETLLRFTERMAGRGYFDFEKRAWASVVEEFKKIFDAAKPEDTMPEPKEFAGRLYTGAVWSGHDYRPAGGYSPALSLSDESIRAWETLARFKDIYQGNKAADYLLAEVKRLDEAQKSSFVNGKLAALCLTSESVKVLRLALERLGPAAEVGKKLAEVDSGKGVNASELWAQLGANFNSTQPGLEQINNAILTILARKPKPDGPVARENPAKQKKDDPPPLMKWVEAEPQITQLTSDNTLETLLGELGARAAADGVANRATLMERRKQEIAKLSATMKGKPPEEVFAAWLAKNHPKTVEVNRTVAQLATLYAQKIGELRQKPPRLDADGVTLAAAAFRKRIGSNTLLWSLGELNPSDCKPEEKVDAGVALQPAAGGDWNPLLDTAWLSNSYEKSTPELFLPADAREPAEATDAKLRQALKPCGDKLPPRLKAMKPEEKTALAARPEADIRKELFTDFESLKACMDASALDKCAKLAEESGMAPGHESLLVKFPVEVYDTFIQGHPAETFDALFLHVAKQGKGNGDGYLMKGKPLTRKEFDAEVPDDKSLSRVIDSDAIDESALNLAAVKSDFAKTAKGAGAKPKQLVAFALEQIQRDPAASIAKYCNGPALARLPGWLVPEPKIASDALFTEYCDLLGLYANWRPMGHLRMTLKRDAVLKKIAEKQLRRPTLFDGMESARWLERVERDHNWGTKLSGAREAITQVDWDDVDQSKWECVAKTHSNK